MRKVPVLVALALAAIAIAVVVATAGAAGPAGVESLVTVGYTPLAGGPPVYAATPFSQNKQNEPGLAVDYRAPNVLAAGTNDEIDIESCAAGGTPEICPFTPGVGVSGVYFSFDGGASWAQPSYSGLTARDCLGPAPCTAHPGPIGTLPWYFESGLASDGDPALVFGPNLPRFSPAGACASPSASRLYYASLASNLSDVRGEQAIKGFEAIAVSRTDCPAEAAQGEPRKSAWARPVIATSKTSTTTFSDKENIWADNSPSSPYYGNAYVCFVDFRAGGAFLGSAGNPEPVEFTRSTNGGADWSDTRQLSPSTNTFSTGGRQGCTIRSDADGVVYVFWTGTDTTIAHSVMYMARSFDGGDKFERPHPVAVIDEVGAFDPNTGRFSFDGVGGARTSTFPSVDIAWGVRPSTIVMTWPDATGGVPSPYPCCPGTIAGEHALVQYSTDRGNTWTRFAQPAEEPGDRPDFPAVAIAPDGSQLYLTYDAFLAPWQPDTASPRAMQGVVRSGPFAGAATTLATVHRGLAGDARGSSQNNLAAEFLGDYNYAVATNTFGAAVWNDVRLAGDCPAVDAYRQALFVRNTGGSPFPLDEDLPEIRNDVGQDALPAASPTRPPVPVACPATFGNSDVFAWTSAP